MPDFASITEKVARSEKVKTALYNYAVDQKNKAQEKLLEDFDNHEITQEIESGPAGDNISNTLPGLHKGGNLFSFIGFYSDDDPIAPIRDILNQQIKVVKTPETTIYKSSNTIKYKFIIQYPELSDFDDVAGYPDGWRDGSWLYGIEHGIFGLSYYLYDEEFQTYAASRSTTGLEAKNKNGLITVRNNSQSRPHKYLSALLRQFAKDVREL